MSSLADDSARATTANADTPPADHSLSPSSGTTGERNSGGQHGAGAGTASKSKSISSNYDLAAEAPVSYTTSTTAAPPTSILTKRHGATMTNSEISKTVTIGATTVTTLETTHHSQGTSSSSSVMVGGDSGGGGTNQVLVLRRPPTNSEMFIEFSKIAIPGVVGLLFMFATQNITMTFVGHALSYKEIAAFSVGLSVYNILGASLGIGLAYALDCLGPQAHGRDPETKELSLLLQRALFVNLILIIPVTIMFLFSGPALTALYGEELGVGAAAFVRVSPLYCYFHWAGNVFHKLLAAQRLSHLSLMGYSVGIPAAYIFNSIFVVGSSGLEGVRGAAYALTGSQVIIVIAMALVSYYHKESLLWRAPLGSSEVLERIGMKEFLMVGAASTVSICSGWWANEILQIFSARLGPEDVAAYTLMLTIIYLLYSFGGGMCMAAGTTIGNSLGANNPELAKRYLWLTLVVVCCTLTCTSAVLYFKTEAIVTFYTREKEILNVFLPLAPYVVLWHILDTSQYILQGIFRGGGQNEKLARLVLSCLWLIGVPISGILGLGMGWGVKGIIIGQLLSLCVLDPILCRDIWLKWDWAALASLASRSQQEEHHQVKGEILTADGDHETAVIVAQVRPPPAEASALHNRTIVDRQESTEMLPKVLTGSILVASEAREEEERGFSKGREPSSTTDTQVTTALVGGPTTSAGLAGAPSLPRSHFEKQISAGGGSQSSSPTTAHLQAPLTPRQKFTEFILASAGPASKPPLTTDTSFIPPTQLSQAAEHYQLTETATLAPLDVQHSSTILGGSYASTIGTVDLLKSPGSTSLDARSQGGRTPQSSSYMLPPPSSVPNFPFLPEATQQQLGLSAQRLASSTNSGRRRGVSSISVASSVGVDSAAIGVGSELASSVATSVPDSAEGDHFGVELAGDDKAESGGLTGEVET